MTLELRFQEAQHLEGRAKDGALEDLLQELEDSVAETDWPIDEGVRDVLLGLWRHGLWTTSSCEGHLYPPDSSRYEHAWRLATPCVGLESPNPLPAGGLHPLEFPESEHQARQEWQRNNLLAQVHLIDLLTEFYAARSVAYAVQLHANNLYGGWLVRLMSVGAEALRGRPRAEQERGLPLLQAELFAFGAFLRARDPSGPPEAF